MNDYSRSLITTFLFDGKEVRIPGKGTLRGTQESAQINPGAGEVQPPRTQVEWVEVEDTTVPTIAEYLRSQGVEQEEASRAETYWIDALGRREDIVLPELGVLHFDEPSQTLVFISNENAGTAWGSEPIALTPRERTEETTSDRPPVVEKEPAVRIEKKNEPGFLGRFGWLLGLLALLLIALIFWAVRQNAQEPEIPDNTVAIRETAPVTSPTEPVYEEVYEEPEVTESFEEPVRELPPVINDNEDPRSPLRQRPANNTGSGNIEKIIIVGSFKNGRNTEKMTRELSEQGYLPYVDDLNNGFTRVGAMFTVRDNQELQLYLRQMRSEFSPQAWVLE